MNHLDHQLDMAIANENLNALRYEDAIKEIACLRDTLHRIAKNPNGWSSAGLQNIAIQALAGKSRFIKDIIQSSVPDGFVIVPVEPTDDIMESGYIAYHNDDEGCSASELPSWGKVYKAMIETAIGKP